MVELFMLTLNRGDKANMIMMMAAFGLKQDLVESLQEVLLAAYFWRCMTEEFIW